MEESDFLFLSQGVDKVTKKRTAIKKEEIEEGTPASFQGLVGAGNRTPTLAGFLQCFGSADDLEKLLRDRSLACVVE